MSLRNLLVKNDRLFVFWCFTAAFGAYFCTYAFRKPFFTGQFAGAEFMGFELKTWYIISQVLGYTCSKFLGVHVISTLLKKHRIPLILGLIMISELALAVFAFVPAPYNIPLLFLNGLPLGLVWGVLFHFLEGRRFTEMLGLGLSTNMIMTSGILKSLYLFLQTRFHFSEFFMPFFIGLLFLPLFLFFVWMLTQIPPPDQKDKALRQERKPMKLGEKREVLAQYGPGIFMIIVAYAFLTTLRDFRDNFAVEIWNQIDATQDYLVFAKAETLIALVVMLMIGTLIFVKNNKRAYQYISIGMIFSFCIMLLVTLVFRADHINAFYWMASLGVGFYLPYLLIQIAIFERLIAFLKIQGNAGYFVYMCDSMGYLGSVFLLFYKELFLLQDSYAELLISFSLLTAVLCLVMIAGQYFYFLQKVKQQPEKSTAYQLKTST